MTNNEVLLRDTTLYAQLRAYGVDPLFLYVSLVKRLPQPDPFPSVEEMMEEIMDEMLAVKMQRDYDDTLFTNDVMVRSNWTITNGMLNVNGMDYEVTHFTVMDMLNELRLPHTVNVDRKIYGVIPQREVW